MNENIYINFSAETSSKDAWAIEFLNSLTITLGKVCDNPMKIHSGNEKDVNSEKLINNANIVLLVFNGFVSDDFSRDMNIIELHQNEYIAEGKEIFVVNKAAKFSSIIPVFLKKFSHYDFFETNTRTNETVEYTPLLKGEKEVKFWSKLTDLVYDIKIFTESRGSIKGDSSRLSVFLAEVSRDQNSNREILRREFLLSDYGVFPIKPLVASYNEFHSSVADILRECDFSIHV
ncbi:MAG TPA: hypothetical protein VHO90_03685, partial [Bacteroidales bacterium]|nr:hypothetical protein [Bacteroidales bacterium]